MSDYISEAQRAFDYATYKQPADKIRQNLSKIYNNPASSAKRWVWELVQNAKDIRNKFGKVSIEIELESENKLIFRHNGDPFKINNIIGLIRQVSSKDSLNEDEETTGKFGTGFICTHILSEIIDINGVLNYQGYRKFDLRLDRSGRSSEELIPRIREVETKFKAPEESFPETPNYEVNRKEEDFDTSFTYFLASNEKQKAAKNGLDDLINTLPITLVTQSKNIKQVHVIDRVNHSDVVYSCESSMLDSDVKLSIVSINDVKKYYLTYETTEVALTTEVECKDGGYVILKRDNKQPVLYRDFPLIGSETFYFPYTLNGFKMNPTEKRNSIPLNGNDNWEAVENRAIINHAVESALKFNNWLIAHNATNRYLIAYSPKPEAEVAYDEDVALPWINNLQVEWRKQLLEQNLLEANDGVYAIKDASIPCFTAANEDFYSLLDGFYFGRGHLPLKEQQQGWLKIIKAEYKTWNTALKYEKEDFLKDLSSIGSISSLVAKLGKTREEVIDWLNKVYKFLVDQNCLADFDCYAIIPNMDGDFKLLKNLYSDASDPIPVELMSLRNRVMTNTLQSQMMDQDIEPSVFGNTLQVFALGGMIEWFNTKIKSNDTYSDAGISYYANCWLAYNLIEFYPNNLEDNEENKNYLSYRQNLYNFSAADGNQEEYSPIEVLNKDLWREADAYWFTHNYQKIEKKGTVEKLAKEYFEKEKTVEETLSWLNDYLKFYRDNSKGDFLKDKKIFPTQRFVFKTLNELRYDNNVEEAFKDLAEYAEKIDFSQEKYRHILLHPSISGYEQHNPLSLKEVYEFVKDVFGKSSGNIQDVIAKHTITIVAKPSDDDEKENVSPEEKLYNYAKAIYGDTIPALQYVTNITGFNWGFAQEYFLKKLSKEISETENLTGLKDLTSEFSKKTDEELIEWVDSFIEYLHTFKNKKYWPIITDADDGFGIWLNQNNDFCRFQDVRKDDNVPEELKDLAAENKHVSHDFREDMFTLKSAYDSYLETTAIDLTEVGKFIDGKIQAYDGDKQDKDFAALIFTVGRLCSSIKGLTEIMGYYHEKKNTLIVGSLGEGDTLDLVGSIIQHGDDKLRTVKAILDGNTVEDFELVKNVLQACPADKLNVVKDFVEQIANGEIPNIGGNTPTGGDDQVDIEFVPKVFDIDVVDADGNHLSVPANQIQYAGLSLEEIENYVAEAKAAVVKYFREMNERNNLGLQFDNDRIVARSYSQLYGISDKNGNEIPLVVHSYKGPQFRYFNLNWYDWQLLSRPGSMLWVLTVSGLQCIPLYALPVRNFNFAIEGSLNLETRAALMTLAQVGKQYDQNDQITFDFGNNMPHGFGKPIPFNYVPNELKESVESIKAVCDSKIPQLTDVYNTASNIPIVHSLSGGYSRALKEINLEQTQREIFESAPNDIQPPVVGTSFFE